MSTFGAMLDRIQDATLRGGDGNRTQIKLELNESIKLVDALVRPAISSSIEVIIANDGDYSLKNDFLITDLTSIRDLVYTPISGNLPITLRETTPDLIRLTRQVSFTSSIGASRYALEGLDLLMIAPLTQATGDTLTIYYVPRPADLTLDADIPVGVPVEWHLLYELACIPRSMRQTSPEETLRYTAMFDKALGDYRRWRNRRAGARSRVVIPGHYRRPLPHDPSTDLRY